jgi:hypothetical protein
VSMFDEYDDNDGPDVGVSRCAGRARGGEMWEEGQRDYWAGEGETRDRGSAKGWIAARMRMRRHRAAIASHDCAVTAP